MVMYPNPFPTRRPITSSFLRFLFLLGLLIPIIILASLDGQSATTTTTTIPLSDPELPSDQDPSDGDGSGTRMNKGEKWWVDDGGALGGGPNLRGSGIDDGRFAPGGLGITTTGGLGIIPIG